MNPLYKNMATSVFERMSLAAAAHGAVNLGQGFPDFGWPEPIIEAAARALGEGSNQYAPSRGLPVLREAVAGHYRRHHGIALDAEGVCVTSGATEALAAAILAVVSPGDEVIIMTPAYDAYAPLVRRAGGVVREVALAPPGWRIERAAVEAAVGPGTRAIVFNNPHNPTGRLFDADEVEAVAAVARANDLIVISDEVWEHVLLDGQRFVPVAALPGMAERTIKCGSAGKIFSLTGWKIGWIAAAPELATFAARAHQFLTFASAPNLQAAVAYGLAEGDAWIAPMQARFARARDRMTEKLAAVGFAVLPSAATYFSVIDLAASGIRSTMRRSRGWRWSRPEWQWCRCRPSPKKRRRVIWSGCASRSGMRRSMRGWRRWRWRGNWLFGGKPDFHWPLRCDVCVGVSRPALLPVGDPRGELVGV